jgi:uncharacterized protein YllA (UPF0747 family)
LNFCELQKIPAIFTDFIGRSLSSQQFLPQLPTLSDLKSKAQQISMPSAFRRKICRLLTKQNGSFCGGEAVLRSIQRLEEPSTSVVLFDLPTYIFGGPLSLLLRCITAGKLVGELAQVGIPAVAVAWLRPCHDYGAECSSIKVIDEEASLKEIKLTARGRPQGSVSGDILVADEISPLLGHLEQSLGRYANPDVMDLLRRSYQPGSPLSVACGRFFSSLLGESGIIMIEPMDPEIQEIARPFYVRLEDRAEKIAQLLQGRLSALRQSGYLTGNPSAVADPDSLISQLRALSSSDLEGRMPAPGSEMLSILMLPLLLGSILPISTVLADPWQLGEFALISHLYPECGQAAPVVFPCLSATLLDARSRNHLDKYALSFHDLFAGTDELLRRFMAEDPAVAAGAELEGLIRESDQRLLALEKESIVDQKLCASIEESRHKAHFQLAKLGERLTTAREERLAAAKRQISRICNTVAPDGELQERQIGMVSFICRHSLSLPQMLETKLDLWKLDHQLIEMDRYET